jgi:bifunctional UDP-N-acetylglucosamine pyrophosphorylase/glucosamine-1-phosphate N-acetyltransferase
MHAYLLAAGQSRRLWPLGQNQSCLTLPVAGFPLLYWWLSSLNALKVSRVSIGTTHHNQVRAALSLLLKTHPQLKNLAIDIVDISKSKGPADTLQQLINGVPPHSSRSLVLFADQYLDIADLSQLHQQKHDACLFRSLREEECSDRLCFDLNHPFDFLYHPRRIGYNHELCALLTNEPLSAIFSCGLASIEPHIQCGMIPSDEYYLEPSLYQNANIDKIAHLQCQQPSFNVDYPWDLMAINQHLATQRCQLLKQHHIPQSSSVSPLAYIDGFVSLGENSHIGAGVYILGNVIIGNNTTIQQGAILEGNNIVGDNCEIKQHCKVNAHSIVGDRSKIAHCAELNGLLFGNNYLNHQCVVNGILGQSTDIGAGTVFGDLRFDDAKIQHNIKGKRITPHQFGQFVYIGDHCRTGVNASLMPGTKVGYESIIGASCCVQGDVDNGQLVQTQPSLTYQIWNHERYGQ